MTGDEINARIAARRTAQRNTNEGATPYKVEQTYTGRQPQNQNRLKVLVAVADRKHFTRKNDFCLGQSDELVIPMPLPFGSYADDETGKARSMLGLESYKRSTVMKVREIDLTVAGFTAKVEYALSQIFEDTAVNVKKKAKQIAEQALKIAASFKVGDIIEYRDGRAAKR